MNATLKSAINDLRRLNLNESADAVEHVCQQNAELVEALRYCRQKIVYMLSHGEWYVPETAVEKADAAIAKATGGK